MVWTGLGGTGNGGTQSKCLPQPGSGGCREEDFLEEGTCESEERVEEDHGEERSCLENSLLGGQRVAWGIWRDSGLMMIPSRSAGQVGELVSHPRRGGAWDERGKQTF